MNVGFKTLLLLILPTFISIELSPINQWTTKTNDYYVDPGNSKQVN